jgi:hypothetical protein
MGNDSIKVKYGDFPFQYQNLEAGLPPLEAARSARLLGAEVPPFRAATLPARAPSLPGVKRPLRWGKIAVGIARFT